MVIEDSQKDQIEALAKKILSAIAAPYKLTKNKEIVISASIGISIYPQSSDVKRLVSDSDIAMLSVKKNEKNGYKFHFTD